MIVRTKIVASLLVVRESQLIIRNATTQMPAYVRRDTQPQQQHQRQHAAFLVLQSEREIGRDGGRDLERVREHPPHQGRTVPPAILFVLFVHGGCLLATKTVGHTPTMFVLKMSFKFVYDRKDENRCFVTRCSLVTTQYP